MTFYSKDAVDEIAKLEHKISAWEKCADDLIDYAREALVQLQTWGKGYPRYDAEIQQIENNIAKYEELKRNENVRT